jgi:hypothetical protein
VNLQEGREQEQVCIKNCRSTSLLTLGDIGDPAMNEDLESKRRIILRKYLDGLISRREAIEQYIALGGKLPDFQASVDTIAAKARLR